MADFAQSLLGIASEAQQAPDIAKSISSGVELAQNLENIQQSRQRLEQAKQQLELQKIEKISGWYESAAKMPEGGARNAFLKNFIPNGINALGMGDKIDPTVTKMLEAQPSVVSYLRDKLEKKELDYSKIQVALSDPATMADLMKKTELEKFGGEQALRGALSEYPTTLTTAASKGVENQQKYERAQLVQQGATQRQATEIGSTGKKEVAKKVADIYGAFSAAGGKASAESNLAKMENALAQLESGQVKTGGIAGITLGNYDKALAATNPNLKLLIDDIRGGMNLRATLADPNPTERQINAVLSRAIDPALPNAQNIKKLRDSINGLKSELKSKQEEFVKQGLMSPEEAANVGGGRSSFSPSAQQREQFKNLAPEEKARALEALAKQFKMKPQEIKKALGE